ncbi:hypothetical protein [Candidatus Tokpelaia sp.]|uniref:hypothetical protein n=1 Tax=Candidatus Tokpelaia sp. TaxID=2233777 RepID=UPI00126FA29D|nr:hypothetical protein [Candidatus Tokpelaia sp.]KAA6405398.1 hypothetical protein DPQ22_04880 [Candidatus Tokpelaia sp.]
MRKNSKIKITAGRPRRFYWTEKTDAEEIIEVEEKTLSMKRAILKHNSLKKRIYTRFWRSFFSPNVIFTAGALMKNAAAINAAKTAINGCTPIWLG